MFIGEYNHNLDEKGRLAIPSKFRTDLKGGVVVTKGLDDCLFLYTKEAFLEEAKKAKSLPTISNPQARAWVHNFLGGAMDLDLDAQGRVVLPEYLRNFANLKKKSVIVGMFDKLEIWDEERWNTYKNDAEKTNNQLAESLVGLGI
ncbi:MAG: division/cell wall cluster transcriptional repressor MraZ [bacterium]